MLKSRDLIYFYFRIIFRKPKTRVPLRLGLSLKLQLSWPVDVSVLSTLFSVRVTGSYKTHPAFYLGAGDPYSGLYAYKASTFTHWVVSQASSLGLKWIRLYL